MEKLEKIKQQEIIKEKDLIMIELENLIINIMEYNRVNNNLFSIKFLKKIIDLLEFESNAENVPSYFKCPISWEKMESPVVSMEGHR